MTIKVKEIKVQRADSDREALAATLRKRLAFALDSKSSKYVPTGIGTFMLKNDLDIQAIPGWEQFNEWGMGSHCGAEIRRIVRAFNVMKDIIHADQPQSIAALETAVLTQIGIICNG